MSAREELLELITKAGGWYTQGELCTASGRASGTTSPLLNELADAGEIQRVKPPAGYQKGVQVLYGPLGMTPPEGATEYVKHAAMKAKPPKTRGFRAGARAKRHARKRPQAKPRKSARARVPARRADERVALTPAGEALITPQAPLWALTSRGTLMLLGTATEIPKEHTRGLIDFIRVLYSAESA